jgi:Na+/melibiose symporter-like transporter
MEANTNNEIFLRPRVEIVLKESTQELIAKFKKALAGVHCIFPGKVIGTHIVIDVPKEEAHFWSPQLHIEIEEIDKNNSQLKGLFGPKPQVWSLFMFFHFALAVAFIGFSIMAYVKMSLNESYTGPLIICISIPVIWVILYFLGDLGKRKGKRQMEALNDFMMEILN